MFRKIVSVILGVLIIYSAFLPTEVGALSDDSVTAPSAVLMEATTGKILYEKNSREQRACASVTKVMTLLLVFEAIDSGKLSLDDTVTASEHAASMGGSDIWLETGETMSADDMIKATVVASANDAAVALAEHISGSEDAFVEQMNSRASELGMDDTVFKNCNGLDEEGHVTSAYDVAVMSRELMKHEKIFDYTSIWLDNLRDGKTQIVNTNKLLKTYNGITGLKTGTTDDAGCCMAASAQRDNVSLVAVVLGCKPGKDRFADAAALLDYGFANISVEELTLPEDIPKSISVNNGMSDTVNLKCEVSASVVLDKNSSAQIETKIDLPESVDAPVVEGQK
ncbi:MAG: D-alanyl-D-alanine carboxypeptidase [Clostridiales bacterium]|nr:D-alanyl-D-alanine carboxypeptidase [Clostridiales bacterium]